MSAPVQNSPPPQFDPAVKMPAAVLAASARAEQFYKSQEADPPPAEDAGKPQEVPLDAKPAAEAPKAPEAPPAPPQAQSQPTGDDQTWEHKFKSAQGRYERAQRQIEQLVSQVNSMQSLMATMQAPAPAENPEMRFERLVTPEEESDYGTEFLGVVGKKAQEVISPEVKALRSKIEELENRLSGTQQHITAQTREAMLNTMDQRLPDWRQINLLDEFKQWLALPDTYSGAIRHELLKTAFDRNDTARVLAFFNGFLAEEATVAPATRDTGRSDPPAKPSLQDFAAPGRAKSAAASAAPAEKPVITRSFISKFYLDVSQGKYEGRDDEKARVERQIFDAQSEGRIR